MANPPDDEELTLYFYGEHPAPDALDRALAEDPALARRYRRLRHELGVLSALEPPAPRSGLENRLWHRLAPELERPRRRFVRLFGLRPGSLALAAAGALALIAGGFLVGRLTGNGGRPPGPGATVVVEAPAALSAEARGRLLAARLTSHLESSERLLLELANDGHRDLDFERQLAESLLASNRLYRRAAERAGQRRIAALLAELEPLFLELANAGGEDAAGAADSVDAARERLESRDLLFKVRVTRNHI